MIRTAIGGMAAGVVLFVVSFLFWSTPLSALAFRSAGETQSAAVQLAMARALTASGTGTYVVPDPTTASGATLYGRGPVALVHFNTDGFATAAPGALIGGLVLALVAGLVLAFAIRLAAARLSTFRDRARLTLLFVLAATLWIDIRLPVFDPVGWGYFAFAFVADFAALAAAGLVIARWFLPRAQSEAAPGVSTL